MKNRPAAGPATTTPPGVSGGLRRYLYFTAAMTGAAIMVIEILGAKMLSPYVGLSHFVWTAQIAVTLMALASGYYAGGRLVDRSQKLGSLYWAILIAACYVAITVLVCEPVAYWCLDFSLPVGSLLASTILFFVPLALLAMTGPFLVRVITSSLTGVGGNVGRLTAIGTVGSFAGTLLIGYLMIPLLPNSVTMYITALALMLVSVGYFGIWHRHQAVASLVLSLVLAGSSGLGLSKILHPRYQLMEERFRGNSHFGQLQVMDRRLEAPGDSVRRYYLNDFLTQNTYDVERKQSRSTFTYMLSGLARIYTTNIHDVLCIGLGVGIVPMDFAHGGAQVDVVEINEAVVPVAQRYFDLEPDKLHITIDDGRHYLNRCRKQYDAVILDAFLGDSSPSHLLTHEAFASIRRVLRPGGVLSINAFGHLDEGEDFFAASLERTLKSVFKSVRIHSTADGGQLFFVASDRAPIGFLHLPDFETVHPVVKQELELAYIKLVETDPSHGRVLTDDYNPAEFYDARNREKLRRALAMSARDM